MIERLQKIRSEMFDLYYIISDSALKVELRGQTLKRLEEIHRELGDLEELLKQVA